MMTRVFLIEDALLALGFIEIFAFLFIDPLGIVGNGAFAAAICLGG